MAGLKLSMPAAASQMFEVVRGENGDVISMSMKPDWAAFFASLAQVAQNSTQTGSTSARPTASAIGRYEGMPFFDRTLGQTIWLKHASSSVWVDATGAVV